MRGARFAGRLKAANRPLEAVSGQVRSARLSRDARGRVRFDARRHVAVHGARLASPRVDELPVDADDPRIVDPNGDGKPGLTVRVEGLIEGALYVVQRGWTVLSGSVDGSDRIRGRVRWGSEQVVVDATHILLTDPPSTRPHRNGRLSYFEMGRVSPETDCGQLLRLGDRIFERRAARR